MKQRKIKFKIRNIALIFIVTGLLIGMALEISYTKWILDGSAFNNSHEVSEMVAKCLKNNHGLLTDCIMTTNNVDEPNLIKDTADSYRYVGENPNNYIYLGENYSHDVYRGFSKTNEEEYYDFLDMSSCLEQNLKCSLKYQKDDKILWRIIGVFYINEVPYTKVVRDESIGEFSFDSSNIDVNEGHGANEWSNSKLFNILNKEGFINSSATECFVGMTENKESCDFKNIGMNETALKKLSNINFASGTIRESELSSINMKNIYAKERLVAEKLCTSGSFCTDELPRNFLTEATVGLISLSDVMNATIDNKCRELTINNWYQKENSDCLNNWLFKPAWLLNPVASDTSNAYVLGINSNKYIEPTFADVKKSVYPTAYLKHEIKIVKGKGTKESPFIIN